MPTAEEELQAKEFLKRAEIRTMKKDLQALREVDALKERDKIAKIKTLEEQKSEQEKQLQMKKAAETEAEKAGREEILQKGGGEERIAEKDLKQYATEPERQQIFLLESQRLGFEKQVDEIDNEKDPALKLENNKLLLKKRDQEAKLNTILDKEKKLEDEQKFITEKAQITTIPSEKKGLEQRRWDLDKEIQDIEKKRWEVEKDIQDTDAAISKLDKDAKQLVAEKNGLKDKILGIDKSLREIYSIVMAREEEQRRGQAKEQIARKEALAKVRAGEKEKVQRQQWTGKSSKIDIPVPVPVRRKISKSFEAEEEQRKKFMQDVENWAQKNESPMSKQPSTPPKN